MVQLFSTILRREAGGGHVLVTPVEKLDIDVEDAPFLAVELKSGGAGRERSLAFRLNTDEVLLAGPGHRLRFESQEDGPHPYLEVRRSEEHTSELQPLMRTSTAVFCLKKKNNL